MEPRFSGHETFPLRYGWLYKSCNLLNKNKNFTTTSSTDIESAVVQLGVGKNMVNAMRYWSEACAMVHIDKGKANQQLTKLGKYLFIPTLKKENSAANNPQLITDPFLEKKGSIWLVHFLLNFNEKDLTSYRYFFNLASLQQFDKDKLVQDLESDVQRLCDKDVNTSTIKKDVDCFLNTYCSRKTSSANIRNIVNEEHFSSPLSELNLLSELDKGSYVSLLEERPDLPTEIFLYALHRFVFETKLSNSCSFDALLSDQNSPGKIFRLSERGLGNQLETAVQKFPKLLALEDSQGLRQIRLLQQYQKGHDFIEFLDAYYGEME